MKWGRFLLGMAAGALGGYLLYKQTQDAPIRPETIVETLKKQYREHMAIVGSWIHVEPQTEEMEGVQYRIYQCGLTGLVDGEPHYLEFKVDADTGHVLRVES
ncbi:putative small secreted protein [Caldalkalibacillus uzonensis]|uniref:Small secreted protein n=1 Tax=Caldalkalibacillus uzonensis TaxID=353224 RepID=A0ABU0CR60_9BACI|nr:PepSY domain-containing protein [Caldalkalibacillus uzonensis]MDQ0338904.1 putative small secreted protein [Caldalkalibacillus uzonensis]